MKRLAFTGAALATLAIVANGCGAVSVNPGGGPTQPPAPVSLTVLNNFQADSVIGFANAVSALSKNTIQIEMTTEVDGQTPDSEAKAIDLVKSGKADIGMIASRAFTAYGVSSYDALIAPFLIDDYALEQQVLASPLIDDMATGLEPIGLVGLGVLPGDLRVLLAKSKPFVAPADFAGASVAHQNGPVGDATFKALGATTGPLATGGGFDRFDAGEEPIEAISGNGLDTVGKFVASNVRLWPRPIVIFMSKTTFDKLSGEQQIMLRDAARSALGGTIEHVRAMEAEAAGISCRRGVRFSEASRSDLAALRGAVAPVYAELKQDPLTKRIIDAVTQMKVSVVDVDPPIACELEANQSPAPSVTSAPSPSGALSPSPAASLTLIEGVWKACPTAQEIRAAGGDPDESKGNAGCWTLTFHQGAFRADLMATSASGSSCSPCFTGTYPMHGDTVTMNLSSGDLFEFTWGVFRDTLTLRKSRAVGAISPAPWLAKPFVRTGD